MFHRIRSLLDQDDGLLTGTVETDEAYIGGQVKRRNRGVSKVRDEGRLARLPCSGWPNALEAILHDLSVKDKHKLPHLGVLNVGTVTFNIPDPYVVPARSIFSLVTPRFPAYCRQGI